MLAAGTLLPVTFTVAAATGLTAALVAASARPAHASAKTALVLLQNGESTAPETTIATADGFTVTQATPATWQGMSLAQFQAFSVLIIGDPSTAGTCSSLTPTTATSGADAIGATWQSAVAGNVSVLGTAPAGAASGGSQALMADAISYAASGSSTGLYVSLNCEYSTAAAGAVVPLLSGVGGISAATGLTVTGQGPSCTAKNSAGTVNKLAAVESGAFAGLASSALGPSSWASPACAVQETFSAWPASFTPVAYDASATASGTTNFTASDGQTGQPYVLYGAPVSAATQALSPTANGEVPEDSTAAGHNLAAPAVNQATAGDPVNTENGDFTQVSDDVSVPGLGPALAFTRTYDADTAQQETLGGAPGPMGYGWTDSLSSSLALNQPTPGDAYTMDGLSAQTGNGDLATSGHLFQPGGTWWSNGNLYIADTSDARIEEVAGSTGTQWGIPMTAGHMYTIVGSDVGRQGSTASGTPMARSVLDDPWGVSLDSAGNLYVADTGNNEVLEVPVASGTQRGISMTADAVYVIAGSPAGGTGTSGDSGPATSALLDAPMGVIPDRSGDNPALEISDEGNNRIQYLFEPGGTDWAGQSFTAGDIYTIAGSSTGTRGDSGNGGAATSALLNSPWGGMCISAAGNLYFADSSNNQVREVVPDTGDISTVIGSPAGTAGLAVDGSAATSADQDFPIAVSCQGSLNLYVTGSVNDSVQEVPGASGTQWGISMTAGKIYNIAGSSAGTDGFSGNGGPATSALLSEPDGLALDSSGNLYIADSGNQEIREVTATSQVISDFAGDGESFVGVLAEEPSDVIFDSQGDLLVANNGQVQELAAHSHTQYGIAMTAGNTYTVAGSVPFVQAQAIAVDPAGNLYIADPADFAVWKVAASTGDGTVLAGQAGTEGTPTTGVAAGSSDLEAPDGVRTDTAGDVFISDDSAVYEVPAAPGTQFGQSMTAGDLYAIAGSAATSGVPLNGSPSQTQPLGEPDGLAVTPAGDIYIADGGDNQVFEIAGHSGTQWGQSMTAGDIYTVAGVPGGTGFAGSGFGDGGPALQAGLAFPDAVALDPAGDLIIADDDDEEIRVVAAQNGTQWGQSMTAGNIYAILGSDTALTASSADGVPASQTAPTEPFGVAADSDGNIYFGDPDNGRVREITASNFTPFPLPPQASAIDITEPDGSKIAFYPQVSGLCAAPYVTAGGYCTLPQNVNATLTFSAAGGGTYTFSPSPGTTYVYGSGGALQSQADAAGNTLTVSYGTPAPGAGNCPATAAACNTVTAASGRKLVIGTSSTGLITSVTDPLGRTWTYAYAAGDLTSAADPMGHVTSYAYGAGTTGNQTLANDLLTMTEPNAQPGGPDAGDATVNTYNALGEVTSQTDPSGFTTTFNYCASAATGSCLNPQTGTGTVTVDDPDGNSTVYDYQQGTLAATSKYTGAALTSETDTVSNTTAGGTGGGTLEDTAAADGNGNVTTTTYDAAGNPVTTTAPDGAGSQTATTTQTSTSLSEPDCTSTAQASSTCQASAAPAPVAPGGMITPPSSVPPQGITWELDDTDGNQLYSTTGVYQPGSSTASYARTTYSLFKGNSITLGGASISCTATPPSQTLPCATVSADGVVTQLAYDSAGDLTSSATPDGNGSQVATTTYAYDADGEETAATLPDGNLAGADTGNYTTTTDYNANGRKTTVTQAGGTGATVTPRTTTYGYDADSNQVSVQDARGFTTTTAYSPDNLGTMVTDPDGHATLTCYDGVGQVAQTVPPAGVAAGSLTASSCPASYPSGYSARLAPDATTYTFSVLGKKTQMTTPAPAGQSGFETTSYVYDGNGNLTQTTAPPTVNGGPNQVTQDSYTTTGQLASETTGVGTTALATTAYCYDATGDRTAMIYGDGNVSGAAPCETAAPYVVSPTANPTQAAYQTTYAYDSARELVSVTAPATAAAPSGATTTESYDAAGNTLARTDPDGVTTTWTYTPLNNPATAAYSGSSAHAVTWGYDADGNRTSMTDATGSSTLTYDPFGELTSATNGAGQTTGYGYNADATVDAITYPLPASATWATSDTVTYGFDHADQLTSVTDFTGSQITIGSTADGLQQSAALGSTGDTITTAYDAADSPSAISLKNAASTLQSFTYSDSPAGTILSETDTPSSALSPVAYTYDTRGRVTSMAPGTSPAQSYGFDASSDLTTLPAGAAGSYDKAGELTSATQGSTTTNYAYNADGEQLTARQGSTTVASGTWNGAAQLTAYSDAAASMTAASYDGSGVRATAAAGGTTQDFTWNTTTSVPQLIMDSTSAYIYDGAAPAEQVSLATGTLSYLVSDMIGSVRGAVSAAGALTASTSYDAWGNPETAGGLTSDTPFGYAGGYTDPTGLVYLINRYYSPQAGQFISLDPAIAQTLQPYEYAGGDPVRNTDPNGLWARTCTSYDALFRTCMVYLNTTETKRVISRVGFPEMFGDWCGQISDALPGMSGDLVQGICGVVNISSGTASYWFERLFVKSGEKGIKFKIWQYRVGWWWFGWHTAYRSYWAWPYAR